MSSRKKHRKKQEIWSKCIESDFRIVYAFFTVVSLSTAVLNQSAESTDGQGLHFGGSRKLSSLSKHEVFEQLLQTLNGERM